MTEPKDAERHEYSRFARWFKQQYGFEIALRSYIAYKNTPEYKLWVDTGRPITKVSGGELRTYSGVTTPPKAPPQEYIVLGNYTFTFKDTGQTVEYEIVIDKTGFEQYDPVKTLASLKIRNLETGEVGNTIEELEIDESTGEPLKDAEGQPILKKSYPIGVNEILDYWNSNRQAGQPKIGAEGLQQRVTYASLMDDLRSRGVDPAFLTHPSVVNYLFNMSGWQKSGSPAFMSGIMNIMGEVAKSPDKIDEILQGYTPGIPVEQRGAAYQTETGGIDWERFYGIGKYEGQPSELYGGATRYPEGVTDLQKQLIDSGALPAGKSLTEVQVAEEQFYGGTGKVAGGEQTYEQAVAEAGLEAEGEAEEKRRRVGAAAQRKAQAYAASPAGRMETYQKSQFEELVKRSRRPQRVTRL